MEHILSSILFQKYIMNQMKSKTYDFCGYMLKGLLCFYFQTVCLAIVLMTLSVHSIIQHRTNVTDIGHVALYRVVSMLCIFFQFVLLQVRQYIHSVNGQYVLRSDHKSVGKLIMQSYSHVTITIMTHKRDAEI